MRRKRVPISIRALTPAARASAWVNGLPRSGSGISFMPRSDVIAGLGGARGGRAVENSDADAACGRLMAILARRAPARRCVGYRIGRRIGNQVTAAPGRPRLAVRGLPNRTSDR
ncbi:hypothetical protein GCM10023340_18580 [Nocardioides marinquilinus]|uniref:Uncharacterized protein n=1 Tax=Nocardioides marinquilinus TaxID=1210400 RepID=A0ABP9PIA1_9ACTN